MIFPFQDVQRGSFPELDNISLQASELGNLIVSHDHYVGDIIASSPKELNEAFKFYIDHMFRLVERTARRVKPYLEAFNLRFYSDSGRLKIVFGERSIIISPTHLDSYAVLFEDKSYFVANGIPELADLLRKKFVEMIESDHQLRKFCFDQEYLNVNSEGSLITLVGSVIDQDTNLLNYPSR